MLKARIGGLVYKAVRRAVILANYQHQRRNEQPTDLEDAIEFGDRLIRQLPRWLRHLAFEFAIPKGISTYLFDLEFPSPVIAAAFKDDLDVLMFWEKFGLGGVMIKTVMPQPRDGNPRPRIQEVSLPQKGLLNAMGLPGKGASEAVRLLKLSELNRLGRPIGISLGGGSLSEYVDAFELANAQLTPSDTQYFFEINISCPNTADGQDMLKQPTLLNQLLTELRRQTDRIILVKLSPDQTNSQLMLFADIVRNYVRVGLTLGNTQYRRCSDVHLVPGAISVGGGGYSGEALFNRTLEMIKLLAPFNIPLVATGGISTGSQVKAVLAAGATLAGMATALVTNPFCVPEIIDYLAKKTE